MKRFTKFAALIIALSSAVILTGADVSFGAFSNENNPIVPIVRRTSIAVVNIDVETIAKRSNIGFPFDDDPIFRQFFGDALRSCLRKITRTTRSKILLVQYL